jgi:hypothetical protein
MKIKATEGEIIFLAKIRNVKERMREETFTSEEKVEYLETKTAEIYRYIIYEILK